MILDEINIFLLDCYNYLQNVLIGVMNSELPKFLSNLMKEDSEHIDSMLRVLKLIVLHAVDKEFSLSCNYYKGRDGEFKAWISQYHPGSTLLFPIERGSGSRQDYTTDSAGGSCVCE